MPSAANGFKFKYDSPSGRTAEELDLLFELPADPPEEPRYKRMIMRYKRFGELPKSGDADEPAPEGWGLGRIGE